MALTGPCSPTRSLLLLLLFLFFLPTLLSQTLVSATVSGAVAAADDDDRDDPCPAISDGGGGACHVSCFRPDPVCGENGVTYWCGCPEAACAGARVAKRGFCSVGNGGAGSVSGQALLLVHIVWLFVLGFAVLFGVLRTRTDRRGKARAWGSLTVTAGAPLPCVDADYHGLGYFLIDWF